MSIPSDTDYPLMLLVMLFAKHDQVQLDLEAVSVDDQVKLNEHTEGDG